MKTTELLMGNWASQLTTLNSGVTFLRAVASPWKRLALSGVNSRLAARALKPTASCFEVLVLLLDSGYFCLQLIDHSFEKFRGLCDSTLEHAIHDRGVLRLEIVRWHFGMVYHSSEFQYESTSDNIFTVAILKMCHLELSYLLNMASCQTDAVSALSDARQLWGELSKLSGDPLKSQSVYFEYMQSVPKQ